MSDGNIVSMGDGLPSREKFQCSIHTGFKTDSKRKFQEHVQSHKKEVFSDRDEFKLIDRVCKLRESNPNIKVGSIQRPLILGGVSDGVFEVEVEY